MCMSRSSKFKNQLAKMETSKLLESSLPIRLPLLMLFSKAIMSNSLKKIKSSPFEMEESN